MAPGPVGWAILPGPPALRSYAFLPFSSICSRLTTGRRLSESGWISEGVAERAGACVLFPDWPLKVATTAISNAIQISMRISQPPIAVAYDRMFSCSELEVNLTLQLSTSNLGIDLAERKRINVQVGICGCRMVEHIACIHAQCQSFRLRNLDGLQEIRVDAPHSRSCDRIQSERSEGSGRGIPQYNFSVRICKRSESAKRR